MGFFDSLKKLDFQKIGNVVGKVASQAGNFASAYSSGTGSTGSKLLSGLGSIDIGEVFEVGVEVKNQIDNVRKKKEQVDIPQQALNSVKEQGFVVPQYTKPSEKQSTKQALKMIQQTADIIEEETQQNIGKVVALERQIRKTQDKLNQFVEKEAIVGRGRVLAATAPLVEELTTLNNQLEEVTTRIVQDSNSHERALNGIKNTINSVTNTPMLSGGSVMFEQRPKTYTRLPFSFIRNNYLADMDQEIQPQFKKDYRNMRDMSRYSGVDMRSMPQKTKFISKAPRRFFEDEDEDEDDEDVQQQQFDDNDVEEEKDYGEYSQIDMFM